MAKDEIYRVAAYSAELDTLMIAVFISDPDFEFPPACGLSIASKRFTHFRVTVIYNFATIPSPMNCFEEVVYTSSVVGTGASQFPATRNSAYSELIESIEPFLISRFVPMANMIRQRRSSIMLMRHAADVPMIRFPRNPPDGFSTEELTYGANPIIGAQRNAVGLRMAPEEMYPTGMFATQPTPSDWGTWTLRRD